MKPTAAEPAVILLGLGSQGRPYLSAARQLGLQVIVVDRAASLGSAKTRALLDPAVDTVALADPSAPSQWYAAARSVAAERAVRGVVAFSEEHVIAAAALAEELRLPTPGLRAALTSRTKSMQRACFAAHRIPQPDWFATTNLGDAVSWLARRPAAVAKPIDRGGSSGVRLVANPEELTAWHGEEAVEEFLLEEYVEGPEFSVELLLRDGTVVFANVTGKSVTAPPFFVETGHVAPADVTNALTASLRATAAAVLSAMDMVTGIAHVELRLDRAGVPRVMEAAVRTPGDFIMEMVGAAYGVDLFELVVRLAARLPISPPRQAVGVAGVVFPRRAPVSDGGPAAPELARAGVVVDTVDPARVSDRVWTDSDSRAGALVLAAPDHGGLARLRSSLLDSPPLETNP